MESHFDTSVYGGDTLAPPGTFLLIREDMSESGGQRTIMLDPVPTSDPNEPLNWSTLRKAVNWTIVLGMTIVTFTLLSIQPIFWQQMIVDLQVEYEQLNQSMSVNFVGLAVGCVIFIPVAKKFGRRPVYIVSASVLLATSFWMSKLETITELYICNLLQGLGGAVNETIAMITIADLFFVHHRGSMNGLYMTMVMIGSFLTPMAAGTQATRQGWRWSYTTLGIFNALFVILFIFLYEETKYTPVISGSPRPGTAEDDNPESTGDPDTKKAPSVTKASVSDEPSTQSHQLDTTIPLNSWRKRLALVTATPESIWPYYYRPFKTIFTFPAVMFAGLQYAAGVIWLTILSSVLSLVFPLPPYLFTPEQIGFMSLGPFIGNLLGAVYGGVLGDWSILYFSRRNNGFYEPEMRLYILHLPALTMAGGIIMFGATIERGMHWIYPSVGGALFGFGLGSIGDASLTLVIDSYRDITGDAFTAIAFLRNACSIGIPFAITPWIARNGLQNMFIACGFISFGVTLLAVPMIFWGKTARRALAVRYYRLVEQQGSLGAH
ncbi:MFS general substrate transporter [Penicillium cosmopolitanum]|uniref:MFS general substrate transporter n=1 Tax=Penicillium cosmopolitanum TaxID=1131564 RepID=A0A9W9SDV0_9EURO|nr:MFS general substrate transporter [Penicillium cosmopolitanum]KAJ5376806.1 MFS general substrate transporter [Penicillium cosmopolitanum]